MESKESSKTSDEIINELFSSLNVPLSPKPEIGKQENISSTVVQEASVGEGDSNNSEDEGSDSKTSDSDEETKSYTGKEPEDNNTDMMEKLKSQKKKKDKKKKKKKHKRKEDGGRHKRKKKKKKDSFETAEEAKLASEILQDVKLQNETIIQRIAQEEFIGQTKNHDRKSSPKLCGVSRSSQSPDAPRRVSEEGKKKKQHKLDFESDHRDTLHDETPESVQANPSDSSSLLPSKQVQESTAKDGCSLPSHKSIESSSEADTERNGKSTVNKDLKQESGQIHASSTTVSSSHKRAQSPQSLSSSSTTKKHKGSSHSSPSPKRDSNTNTSKKRSRSRSPKETKTEHQRSKVKRSRSRSRTRKLSSKRSRSCSRKRSRSKSRKRSQSRSKSIKKSKSDSRRKTRSRSRKRSASKSRTSSHSSKSWKSRSRDRSRSRKGSKSKRSRSKSRRRSHSRSRSRHRKSRSRSHKRSRSRSRSKGKSQSHRSETRGKSRSHSPHKSSPPKERFDMFAVMKERANRLAELKSQGIPDGSLGSLLLSSVPTLPLPTPDPSSIPLPHKEESTPSSDLAKDEVKEECFHAEGEEGKTTTATASAATAVVAGALLTEDSVTPSADVQDTSRSKEPNKGKQEEGHEKSVKAKTIITIKSLKDSLVFQQAQEEADRKAKEHESHPEADQDFNTEGHQQEEEEEEQKEKSGEGKRHGKGTEEIEDDSSDDKAVTSEENDRKRYKEKDKEHQREDDTEESDEDTEISDQAKREVIENLFNKEEEQEENHIKRLADQNLKDKEKTDEDMNHASTEEENRKENKLSNKEELQDMEEEITKKRKKKSRDRESKDKKSRKKEKKESSRREDAKERKKDRGKSKHSNSTKQVVKDSKRLSHKTPEKESRSKDSSKEEGKDEEEEEEEVAENSNGVSSKAATGKEEREEEMAKLLKITEEREDVNNENKQPCSEDETGENGHHSNPEEILDKIEDGEIVSDNSDEEAGGEGGKTSGKEGEEVEAKASSKSHSRKKSKKDKTSSKEKKKSHKEKSKNKEERKREREKKKEEGERERSRIRSRSRSRERHKARHQASSKDHSHSHGHRHRRRSRTRSRSRSRSYSRDHSSRQHHRSHSRSRSKSRSKRLHESSSYDLRDKVTRKRLLEIARRNAVYLMQNGCLPRNVEQEQLVKIKAPGKSVDELTDFCKQLVASGNYSDVDASDPSLSSEEENNSEKPFSSSARHPFSVRDNKPILMNIRNAPMLPTKTNAERLAGQAKLREQFPVSSGSQHRTKESEWVPVLPKEKEVEDDKVFTKPETPAVDISQIVSTRLSAMRKLQDNPNDSEAIKALNTVQKEMQNWALSKQEPGQFTGTTGVKVLSQEELSSGHQAWARKEQFKEAKPVRPQFGLKMLQKMGWSPGEGLGKNKEGTTEPLLLDVKMDKKGFHAQEEVTPKKHPVPLVKDLSGKHPVSALVELCSKRKWSPPDFEMVFDCGPDHKKNFLMKVMVNGQEFKPSVAASTKKIAKANAAAAYLQSLGLYPKVPHHLL